MTAAAGPGPARTTARRKARQLARYLRAERPGYAYLKEVFRHLREELDIGVARAPKKLPRPRRSRDPRVLRRRLESPPLPAAFRETLALHIDAQRRAGAAYLFESSWKKPCSDRGVRKILARHTQAAGITASISPHTLRHFLLTWLKAQGIDDALIQPCSGHATRQSPEICSRLALADAQRRYDDVIGGFPV